MAMILMALSSGESIDTDYVRSNNRVKSVSEGSPLTPGKTALYQAFKIDCFEPHKKQFKPNFNFIKRARVLTVYEILSGSLILLEMYNMSFLNSLIGALGAEFHISLLQIPYLYLAFSIGAATSIPLTKMINTKFSLHISLYLLIGISLIASLTSFFSHHWIVFCLARGVQGFTLTLLYSLTFIKAIEFSKNRLKTLNNINGLSILGMILGPLVSGYLYLSNWRISYLLTSVSLLILCWIIYRLMPRSIKLTTTEKFPWGEYLLLVIILSGAAYLSDISKINHFGLLVIVLITCAVGIVIYSYSKPTIPKLFNQKIFNYNLMLACSLNFLARFALVGIPPLYSYILHEYYSYSITQISLFLMFSGVFSLLAKVAFYLLPSLSKHSTGAFLGFALFLIIGSWLMRHPEQQVIYFIIFALYGFFSSLVFNFVNLSFYSKQDHKLTSDLTVIASLFQMFVYGICVNATLFFWQYLTRFGLTIQQIFTSTNLVLAMLVITSYFLFRKVINYEN